MTVTVLKLEIITVVYEYRQEPGYCHLFVYLNTTKDVYEEK